MKHFAMDYWKVLRLPLKMFWSLNRQVTRLKAEEDIRLLRVFAAAQASEAFKTLHEELITEMDSPVVLERTMVETEFDEGRFAELQQEFFGQGGS